MSLLDSVLSWKDIFNRKDKNLKLWDYIVVYFASCPAWSKYSQECDFLIDNIIKNYDKIEKFEFNEISNDFSIVYYNGRKIKIPMRKNLSFFLENIELYDNSGKLVFKFRGKRPSRKSMIKFLDKFYKFIYIDNGEIKVNLLSTENWKEFFTF